ncbi:Uncharacterised protein [Bordetella pertussis]|nr:Uncharacterised protein [Bordetella pertussis]
MNSSTRRPGRPMPTRASSQPASPRRSTKASRSLSASASWYLRVKRYSMGYSLLRHACARRCLAQLSTTRRRARAWWPGFLGVLQMLVMQNSPQRHSLSLYGQYMRPQAWPPRRRMYQPCASACLSAASTSLSGCGQRVMRCFPV